MLSLQDKFKTGGLESIIMLNLAIWFACPNAGLVFQWGAVLAISVFTSLIFAREMEWYVLLRILWFMVFFIFQEKFEDGYKSMTDIQYNGQRKKRINIHLQGTTQKTRD